MIDIVLYHFAVTVFYHDFLATKKTQKEEFYITPHIILLDDDGRFCWRFVRLSFKIPSDLSVNSIHPFAEQRGRKHYLME
jgi:hypothetical protein